jgi:Uncharacterized protein conserved in bacteria
MQFLCFGYLDEKKWATLSPGEQNDMIDRCFSFDEVLKKEGHWAWGNGIQGPEHCATLQFKDGKVVVTDGPYAETKELLGGLLVLEAQDRAQAIQLISRHPGVQMGRWEIRPVQDITPMVRESEQRRAAKKK